MRQAVGARYGLRNDISDKNNYAKIENLPGSCEHATNQG